MKNNKKTKRYKKYNIILFKKNKNKNKKISIWNKYFIIIGYSKRV